MDSLEAVAVVAASAVMVILIIVLMSRSRPGRTRRIPVEANRREITSRERRSLLESQRQQPRPGITEERLIPSLNEQPKEPRPSSPVSPVTEADVPSLYPEEEPAGSSPPKTVEIPAVEDDGAEFAEEVMKQKADAGLSAFMVEVSEDDGLSKIAGSLEDFDAGNLAKIARDILSKRSK